MTCTPPFPSVEALGLNLEILLGCNRSTSFRAGLSARKLGPFFLSVLTVGDHSGPKIFRTSARVAGPTAAPQAAWISAMSPFFLEGKYYV